MHSVEVWKSHVFIRQPIAMRKALLCHLFQAVQLASAAVSLCSVLYLCLHYRIEAPTVPGPKRVTGIKGLVITCHRAVSTKIPLRVPSRPSQ